MHPLPHRRCTPVAVAVIAAATAYTVTGCAFAPPAPRAAAAGVDAPAADPASAAQSQAGDDGIWPQRPVRAWPLAEVEVERDGTRDTEVLWPLYRSVDGPEGRYRRLGPLWFQADDAARRYAILAPLLWLFHDKRSDVSTEVGAPLWFRRRSPRTDLGTAGAMYWWWRDGEERHKLLLPLGYAHDAPGRARRVLFPFYWAFEDPDARTTVLWPLFGRSEDATEVSFSLLSHLAGWNAPKGDPKAATSRMHLAPFVFWRHAPDREHLVLFPFVWSFRDHDEESLVVFPLMARGGDADGRWAMALPPLAGMRRSRDGKNGYDWGFPLWWRRFSPEGQTIALVPLYASSEDAEKRTHMPIPPLVRIERSKLVEGDGAERVGLPYLAEIAGHERSGERSVFRAATLFPGLTDVDLSLARVERSKEMHAAHLFPLYWAKSTPEGGYRYLVPLGGTSREGARRTYRLLPPLFRYVDDPDAGARALDAPWPLVAWHRTPEERHLRALPLVWWTERPDDALGIVFPFVWSWRQGPRRTLHVLPFYGQVRDGDRVVHRHILGPVYMRSREPLPEGGERVRTDVLWPFGMHETAPGELHVRALPLLWHDETKEGGRTVGFPLYWRFREGEDESSWLVPFYGRQRRADGFDRRMVLPPLWIHTRSPEETRTDVLFPLVSWARGKDHRHFRALPLAWFDERPDDALGFVLPFFWTWRDGTRTHTHFLPFYGETREGDRVVRRHVLGPVFMRSREPVAEGGERVRTDVLWPLGMHETAPGERHVRAFPLLWHDETKEGGRTVGFPLYWRFRDGEREVTHFFPFYGEHKDGDRLTRRFVLGPAYVQTRTPDEMRHDLLFPLFSWASGKDRSHVRALPLLWHDRAPGEATDVLFPFWARIVRDDRTTQLFAGPLYVRRRGPEGEAGDHILWPLFGREKTKDREHLRAFPFYFGTRERFRSDHAFLWPLGSYERAGDSARWRFAPLLFGRSSPEEAYTIAPALFYRRDSREQPIDTWDWRRVLAPVSVLTGGGERRVSLLGTTLSVATHERGDYDFRLLHKLVQVSQEDGVKTRSFAPLFRYEANAEKGYADVSVLGPLFRYVKEKGKGEVRILHFIRI